MSKATDQQALAAIEDLVSDDFLFEMEWKLVNKRLRGEKRTMVQRLLRVYEISHGFNRSHSCHHVHKNWRELPAQSPVEKGE